MAKTVEIIAQNEGEGGVFVAKLDNGQVRLGHIGRDATDADHPAFLAAADIARGLNGDALDDLVYGALKARYATLREMHGSNSGPQGME